MWTNKKKKKPLFNAEQHLFCIFVRIIPLISHKNFQGSRKKAHSNLGNKY